MAVPCDHPSQPSADATAADPDLPGYVPIRWIAAGTFSDLWQVRHAASGELYALKVLHEQWRNDADVRQLWANEIRVGPRVRSRRVVSVIEGRHDGAHPYVLLEWIDGSTLEDRLARQGRVPLPTAVWIARQCAEGLADLAEAGLAHGDLKPSNLLVTGSGELKLIDLGFAVPVARRPPHSRPLMTGTPEYMAPERLSREPANPVTMDIYSLGLTLYRMLTGRRPFRAETVEDVLRQQRQARPPALSQYCPSAPPELIALIHRMLAKQPLRRPHNPARLVRELIALELAVFPGRLRPHALPSPHRTVPAAGVVNTSAVK